MIRNVPYTLYALEHIGLPILSAAGHLDIPKIQEPEAVSKLLDQAVLLTGAIERTLDLPQEASAPLPVKLHLAALACRLLNAQIMAQGQMPEGTQAQTLKSLSLIVGRAEQFSFPPQSHADDLIYESPPPELGPLAVLKALSPCLQPIAEFSFGISETKLIQNVSDTILTRAQTMTLRLLGAFPDPEAEQAACTHILLLLGPLYAETHKAETQKIMTMDERIRQNNASQLTIDIVWRAFDKKCAMLEALIDGLIPADPLAPPAPATPPPQTIPQPHRPAQAEDHNPLSFFRKTSKT